MGFAGGVIDTLNRQKLTKFMENSCGLQFMPLETPLSPV